MEKVFPIPGVEQVIDGKREVQTGTAPLKLLGQQQVQNGVFAVQLGNTLFVPDDVAEVHELLRFVVKIGAG